MGLRQVLIEFAKRVWGDYCVDFDNTDLRRLYFYDTEDFIRMWNITDEGIKYSVYRLKVDGAEELKDGYYIFNNYQ